MHSSKVYASIEGKNCESWINTNDEQHLKQHGTILYTEWGITICCKLMHLLKELSPIWETGESASIERISFNYNNGRMDINFLQ